MKKKSKNICMIVYADYITDTRVRREAETLAELPGFNVTVLALKRHAEPNSYNVDGVNLIEINEGKYYGESKRKYILSYLKFMCLSLVTCTKLWLSGNVDIVHVHNMPNFLVFSAAIPRLFGKKVVLDLHDTVPETYAAKFDNGISLLFSIFCMEEWIACAFATRIICVNHVQEQALLSRGISKDKITICMNVPDPKLFDAASLEDGHNNTNSNLKLVYHGTIAKRLGIDLILQAIHRLENDIPNIKFYIWGRVGGDLRDLLKLTEEMNIEDRIRYHDPLPIIELIPELQKMDIGVIGNRRNAATELMLPVKMMEYIALNIPVVVPRLKGIEYYFTEEMVSYYEPENIDSLAGAIRRLYEDPALRKYQTEKAKAFLEEYGWEKHKMGLIDLYTKLLGKRRRKR